MAIGNHFEASNGYVQLGNNLYVTEADYKKALNEADGDPKLIDYNALEKEAKTVDELEAEFSEAQDKLSGENKSGNGLLSGVVKGIAESIGNTVGGVINNAKTALSGVKANDGAQAPSATNAPSAATGAAATQAAEAVTETDAAAGATSAQLQEEIDKLNEERQVKMDQIEEIEDEIEDLVKEAEKEIEIAAKKQDKAVEEHEEKVQKVIDENIRAYVEANKEGGDGMTREQLASNIGNAMPNLPQVSEVVRALTTSSKLLDEVDSLLGDLNGLIRDVNSIDKQIEVKQGAYEAAVKAEQEAAAKKSCDPIGFTMGEGEETVKYDFIVDDGAFDSTSDFLGADNQWAAMQALDADGDQTVTAEELKAGNIKAVKTNADGSQEIVDLAEEFGDDFSIDLKSYAEGGSHSAVDANADHDFDGVADQELLGTFNLNIGGESVQGYNTLDDVDWLSENYGIDVDETSSEAVRQSSEEAITNPDLKSHITFYTTMKQKVAEMRESINEGYKNIGVSEENMMEMDEIHKKEADLDAKKFLNSIGINEEDKTDKTQNVANEITTGDGSEEEEEELELEKE